MRDIKFRAWRKVMTINIQKSITWINDTNAKVDLELLNKAALWYSNKPMASQKHIYMHGQYAGITVDGKKEHVHRLLMEYFIGSKLPENMSVHHLDGNKLNDEISNLAIMVSKYHNSYHNAGKVLSMSHRQKISNANKRRRGIKIKKRLNIPENELTKYLSDGLNINQISKIYHCSWRSIRDRVHENADLLEEQ